MKTAIVPIMKNKTGDTSDKNNYRPIALVTAASKLFEICILEILETYLITHDHQFGFKAKHSTDMCIFTIKTLVKYYTDQMTPKLIETGAPLLIVRVLLFWYQKQQVCIKWGNSCSTYFTICNRPFSQTVFMLSIAINRAEHVRATVIIKHNYMIMCNHKIAINLKMCLLNSTGHI